MTIDYLGIKNFKNFTDLNLGMGPLNVVIGPNASGKTNFIQIFRFLKDIAIHDLENAISLQGGREFIRNIKYGMDSTLDIEIGFKFVSASVVYESREFLGLRLLSANYSFSVDLSDESNGYKIIQDELLFTFEVQLLSQLFSSKSKAELIGTGEAKIIANQSDRRKKALGSDGQQLTEVRVEITTKGKRIGSKRKKAILDHFQSRGANLIPANDILINTAWGRGIFDVVEFFRDFQFYDIDPKKSKDVVRMTGKVGLEEDGSNLAIVLSNLRKDKEKWKTLISLLSDLLPFVKDLSLSTFANRGVFIELEEDFFDKQQLPAPMLSDGTIGAIALLIAIFFEQGNLAIIEEPERNLHPAIVSRLVEMIQEGSQQKQIIVTTHDVDFVRYSQLDDIVFLSRSGEGFTNVMKPSENLEVKYFLENDLGIDDLFSSQLLEKLNLE